MAAQQTTGAATFKEMEQAGWQVMAPDYDAPAGQITIQPIDALLDAAKVRKGAVFSMWRAAPDTARQPRRSWSRGLGRRLRRNNGRRGQNEISRRCISSRRR